MAGLAIRLIPETLRSLAFGSIGAAYMGVGTAFTRPIRIIHIQNLTDVQVIISFDGVNDHLVLPRNGYLLLDVTANKTREQGFYIAEGTRVYAKEDSSSPTAGGVYLTAFAGVQ